MKHTSWLVAGMILAGAILTTAPAWTDDVPKGKALHDANCNDCHAGKFGGDASKIYTRSDRKMASLTKLAAQVAFCNQQVGTQWFDDDVADVTAYLNDSFYKFAKDGAAKK